MNALDLRPTSSLVVKIWHRSDGDLAEMVHAKLHLAPHKPDPSEIWSPNVKRFDVLLPVLVPDELQQPKALLTSFLNSTDPRQNAMALHLKFTQLDELPGHMHWEVAREFLLAKVVDVEATPAVMIRHDPYERGFADAAPPHIHAIVLARKRLLGSWGPTTPVIFDRRYEALIDFWQA